MRPFQGFKDKIPIEFTHDSSWHTVTITGIPDDASLVTIETYTPTGADIGSPETGNVGIRPTGTFHADGVFLHTTRDGQYETTTMRVNSAKEVDFLAVKPDVQFSVIAAWGGPGVVAFGPTFPLASGWTYPMSEKWRDYDLSPKLPLTHRGNLEAVICYFRTAPGSDANARPNESTWDIPGSPPSANVRGDGVVKVDVNDVIEVYEGDDGTKYQQQNSWVYFVGYVLKGAYANFDDGKFYRYKALLNPSDDGIYTPGDAWDTYNMAAHTVSPTVAGVYWRMQQYAGAGAQATYAREVGSTNPTLSGVTSVRAIPGFPLNVDANGEIEYNLEDADTGSWLFGYVEEYKKRSRVIISHW